MRGCVQTIRELKEVERPYQSWPVFFTETRRLCAAAKATAACAALLAASDDEFFLTAQADGYLHTGQFGAWNLTTVASAYVVPAVDEAAVAAAVAFARAHNLRLAVKNTGHDWYGKSTARNALVVWTHVLNGTTWHDGGLSVCGAPPVPAVTVGPGVQFRELYAAAQARGRLVMGGTCDSVGVGGCWLGGCFGTFSKLFGSGASNLLSARVVLPDGSAVTASACEHADLFWALRGGAAGVAGVVTSFTARTHPAPRWVTLGSATLRAVDDAGYEALLGQMLAYSARVMAAGLGGAFGGGGVSWGAAAGGGGYVSLSPKGYETSLGQLDGLFSPALAFAAADPARFSATNSSTVWNASAWTPGAPVPWIEVHPDREISTALLGSLSRLPSARQIAAPGGAATVARALAAVSRQLPAFVSAVGCNIDFEKGQSGASAFALGLLAETSQNPVLPDALGLLLLMFNVPSLPTVPPSAGLLAALWPRLQRYVIGPGDALFAGCAAGAAGNETAAAGCFAGWAARVPALQAQLDAARDTLLAAFPNVDPATGEPLSGGYVHETDFRDADWARSQWGDATYARLLAVKDAYDPDGLFIVHHGVGSERWTPDGNCRV